MLSGSLCLRRRRLAQGSLQRSRHVLIQLREGGLCALHTEHFLAVCDGNASSFASCCDGLLADGCLRQGLKLWGKLALQSGELCLALRDELALRLNKLSLQSGNLCLAFCNE